MYWADNNIFPTGKTIWFSVRGNNWKEAITKAMQEALARLCGQNVNKIKNTRFFYYPRHDSLGRPITMPPHPELSHYVAYLEVMLYKTRKDLDDLRAFHQTL